MKAIAIAIIILLSSCDGDKISNEESLVNDHQAVIGGKIEGSYWNEVELHLLDVYTENFIPHSFIPDSSQVFKLSLDVNWPTQFYLTVSNNRFDGWVFPGDSVFIQGDLSEENEKFIRTLLFSGRGKEKYSYFQKLALNPVYDQLRDSLQAAKKLPYKEFLTAVDSIQALKRTELLKDTEELSLEEDFIRFRLKLLKYTILKDKVSEPFLRENLRFDSTKVPQNYYSFLDQVDFKDSTFSNNVYYYRFLEAAFYVMINEEIPTYPIKKRLDLLTSSFFVFADSLLPSEVEELFETKFIRHYRRVDLQAYDSMISALEKKGYDNFMLEQSKQIRDSLTGLEFLVDKELDVYTKTGQPVSLLNKLEPGQYTYVSAWYVGCKGCAMDFQNKAALYQKYKDKVQMINICVEPSSKRVEQFLERFAAVGQHFFDNDNSFRKEFNIQAYPASFLFNQRGELVENNFYRPGDPKLDAYLDRLN